MRKKRKDGFYWIMLAGVWTIGQYRSKTKDWRQFGSTEPFKNKHIDQIDDERIFKFIKD